jgi:hypothetical protein
VDGTETGGGADLGTETVGAVGVVTEGVDTVGTDTVGTETVGVDTVGTDTVGTVTVGVDTVGTDTVGTVTAGLACGWIPKNASATPIITTPKTPALIASWPARNGRPASRTRAPLQHPRMAD